jgi:hypothetical protein
MADLSEASGQPASPRVRKGQGDVKLSREEFVRRLGERFYDPAYDSVRAEIDRIIEVAWTSYSEYHKSPRTRKPGPGFADPDFELSGGSGIPPRPGAFSWCAEPLATMRPAPARCRRPSDWCS